MDSSSSLGSGVSALGKRLEENATDTAFINSLPQDLMTKIFLLLNISTFRACCLTNKAWERSLKLESNSSLWKNVFFQNDKDSAPQDPILRLQEMGLGGLHAKGKQLLRQIIAERCSPLREEIKKRSVPITRGLLVSGPSGTGKSLLVRSLCKLLNVSIDNMQRLSGTQTYNKWAEGSEANVKELFAPTFKAMQTSKNDNDIFLIVIDELDVILPKTSKIISHNWISFVSKEFRAQMDLLKKSYNILIVGITNRLYEIDETAISLFDEHLEIAIPNLQERKEILHVHTLGMDQQNFLAADIDFDVLAKESEGLTGANIHTYVNMARDSALQRLFIGGRSRSPMLTMYDLHLSLHEVKKRMEEEHL